MPKERKVYIDVARGAVILLVALGHLVSSEGVLWLQIFAFHMPFFFILSGYCTGEQSYELPFGKYLIKYVKSLLVPAAVIRILFILVGMSYVEFTTSSSFVFKEIFLRWGLRPDLEWFIPVLFLSKLLFYWVHKLIVQVDDPKAQNVILFFIVGMAFYLGETWASKGYHDIPIWFPARIDCTMVALSFCIVGYWCRKEDLKEIYVKNKRLVLLAGGGASLLILYLMRYQSHTNVAYMSFGNSGIGYGAFACVLSFYTLALCRWICETFNRKNVAIRTLALFGRNTILVYPGHSIIHYLLENLLYWYTGTDYIPMSNLSGNMILLFFAVDIALLLPVCYGGERLRSFKRKHRQAAAVIDWTFAAGLFAAILVRVYLARYI